MISNSVKPRSGLLGVLGGMGPAATVDFYRKLVESTPAARDQDHIPIVIVGDPRIADRSQAIESGNASVVLGGMLERLRYLESIDVDVIAIPCNTAHFWLPSVRAATPIPFIDLVEASVVDARRRHPRSSTALVLGTRATLRARIYDAELRRANFMPVSPLPNQQDDIDTVISMVKAGQVAAATAMFEGCMQSWRDRADVILLACTELPIAAGRVLRAQPTLIDTTAALVDACVAWFKR